jgi:hypothetical protein
LADALACWQFNIKDKKYECQVKLPYLVFSIKLANFEKVFSLTAKFAGEKFFRKSPAVPLFSPHRKGGFSPQLLHSVLLFCNPRIRQGRKEFLIGM